MTFIEQKNVELGIEDCCAGHTGRCVLSLEICRHRHMKKPMA